MFANSLPVTSSQSGIHENLPALLKKHSTTQFRKPVMPYNRAAFELAMEAWENAGRHPLILDAGCGVGLSTRWLAAHYPDHYVIGVDQSAHRLARNIAWEGVAPGNFVCVRADLVDFWRLLLDAGVRLSRHCILYPNPWPKIGQIQRRWHGHPVFPTVIELGGIFECRSNWRIYIEECALALRSLSGGEATCEPYPALAPITPFEYKYKASGHALWRVVCSLPEHPRHR